jgi:hypothetical protein
VLAACETTSAPLLRPVSGRIGTETEADKLTVLVRPIDTAGFNNADRRRLGLDVSSYFTAFEVSVVNRTERSATFDPTGALLEDADGLAYRPLTEAEALDYYRFGEGDPSKTVVIVPKARKIAKKESDQLSALRLKSQDVIPSGHFVKGVLFFRKVPPNRCDPVRLKIQGVRIENEQENREFAFTFSCPTGS